MKQARISCFLFLQLFSGLAAQSLPTPEGHLGFAVGTDRRLADWSQIVSYFERLNASPRVRVDELGPSTEGRPFLLVTISAPETLERLEHFRSIQTRLADPRKTELPLEQALESGKTVVLVTCAIHSTEVASAQMAMEFAYEMAVSDDPEFDEILRNVIFLLVPSLNPDGIDIVNHWYRRTLDTPAEGTSPPRLYHKYTGHDNNRDWYMFTQQETRLAIGRIHNRWHPQIVYDIHQMGSNGARIFVPPFIDPYEPNVDPLIQGQIISLGGAMFSALLASGRRGVVTNAIYDAFTPARAYQHYHGGVRILSESASARLATPVEVGWQDLQGRRNFDPRQTSWNFPRIWPGGIWRIRDIVDDQKTALKACLLHAARYRREWLKNFHQIGLNALARESPAAFLVPPAAQQRDRQSWLDLLEVLAFGQVELLQADQPFEAETINVSGPYGSSDRRSFPAGTVVIDLKQPYGGFAKTMLEIQHYPTLREYSGGPLQRPYDVTAHTLGVQLGVEVYQANQRGAWTLEEFDFSKWEQGEVEGEGRYWLFSHSNNAFARLTNRLLERGYPTFWAPNGFQVQGKAFPVGTLMARGKSDGSDSALLASLTSDLPIRVERSAKWPQLAWQRFRQPRIGLYEPHVPTMDAGWLRWLLEKHEFAYSVLENEVIEQGKLPQLDVIILPHQSPERLLEGLPATYPEEFRGGLVGPGLHHLREFVEQGGTLIALGSSTHVPITAWELEVEEVTGELRNEEFYVPGSLLLADVNNRHPIGFGMNRYAGVMFLHSPVFQAKQALSVVDFGDPGRLLLSGWIDGAQHLQGRSGLVEVQLGEGRVILIGFRPQFRAQTRATYKLLFNSLYYSTVTH